MNTPLTFYNLTRLLRLGRLVQTQTDFLGSSGFSITITPTLAGTNYFYIYSIHWVVDTGLASGGSTVNVSMRYLYNGSDRLSWTSIFSEFIDTYMDDAFYFLPNGSNNIQFILTNGSLNVSNGFFVFQGVYM